MAELPGYFCLEDGANADALAVENGGGENGLDGMADRVSKVDEVPQPRLAFVYSDNVGLDGDAADDNPEEKRLARRAGFLLPACKVLGRALDGVEDLLAVRLEEGKIVLVPYGGGLDDLGHAIRELACGEGLKERSVDEDVLWLPKCADEVLAVGGVDCGLPAHTRVDHGEEGGRNLYKAHAAHASGGF